MTWMQYYLPPNNICWQGRQDTTKLSCYFQKMFCCNLQQDLPIAHTTKTFALLGFCCDEGIRRNQGRIGASQGPDAIRTVLAKLALTNDDFFCYDVGNIACTNDNLEASQQALADIVALLLQQQLIPIILGGGHELAFGQYQGIMQYRRFPRLGIVNFDAHFDMRPLLANQMGSSGTPFLQIATSAKSMQQTFHYYCIGIQPAGNIASLFETAKLYDVDYLLAEEVYLATDKCIQCIDNIIHQHDKIYLSFCLDVLASAYAPGVSAPQALGLTPWQLLPFIRKLAQSGKIISYDIAELSPPYDIDQRTAKLAAHFIQEIIHHHALKG